MLRVDLPSGGFVEIRDKLVPGDRFAVQDAPDVIARDGAIVIRNAAANTMPAFLARVVTSWSFPGDPAIVLQAGARALDDFMDLDDWDALEQAVAPLLAKARPPQDPNPQKPLPQQSAITSG